MSATLFREGYDLDEVLAELEEEYPGRVRVVDVSYGRNGGVMGFFAQRTVGVRYLVEDTEQWPDAVDGNPHAPADPLAELLQAADSAEARRAVAQPAWTPPSTGAGNVEFARMLLEMAAQKAAERAAVRSATDTEDAPAGAFPAPEKAAPEPRYLTGAEFTELQFATEPETQPAPEPLVSPIAAAATVQPPAPALQPTYQPPTYQPATYQPAAPAPQPMYPPATYQPAMFPPAKYQPAAEPAPATRSGSHRAAAAAPVAAPSTRSLRRNLTDLGVPAHWLSDLDAHADPYSIIRNLVATLPPAPAIDLEPGQLLVVAGPAREALHTARRISLALRLDPNTAVYAAGCGTRVAAEQTIATRWDAARVAAEVRTDRRTPVIVAISTDIDTDADLADDTWAASLIATLGPAALWLAIDAGRKAGDIHAAAEALGAPVSALTVFGAARTTSPASVWDLGAPIATIDGRAATRGTWTALLLDKLDELAQ